MHDHKNQVTFGHTSRTERERERECVCLREREKVCVREREKNSMDKQLKKDSELSHNANCGVSSWFFNYMVKR